MNGNRPATRIVHIHGFDKKGHGSGETETGGRVAVPYSIPGETVEAVKRRRVGTLVRVVEPSPHRTEPVCRHFGVCGGCRWQHVEYGHQLEWKRRRVRAKFDALGVDTTGFEMPVQPSPPYGYRNRMDFVWWFDGRLGLREQGKWHKMVNLEECRLVDEGTMEAVFEANRRAHALGLPFHDQKYRRPGLRYAIVRRGIYTGDLMLNLVSDPMNLPAELYEGLPGVTSVYQLVNADPESAVSDGEPVHRWGETRYRERILGREFIAGPRTFFQPNPAVAETMVECALEWAGNIQPRRFLADLYCGAGLFTAFLSEQFERTAGIELSGEALDCARLNAPAADFIECGAESMDAAWIEGSDLLLADPPREGLLPKALDAVRAARPGAILYVSCNPARGAEDIQTLLADYRLAGIRLFDQFPQTPHVEMMALLERRI